MTLESYAPALSLLLLGILGLVSFARVRALMARFGATPGPDPIAPVQALEEECPEGPEPCAYEYVMRTPVELWFGDVGVAVRSGSDTDRRFQRFAEALFEELRASRQVP